MSVAVRPKYFIISLDGGGVRCALQIVLLQRIFNRFPSLESKVRLVAGTSAGALVGAALGALGCDEMVRHMLNEEFAQKIFCETWSHEVRSMRGLYRAAYTNSKLLTLLQTVFGPETPLNHYCHGTAMRPDLLFTSFRIDTADRQSGKDIDDDADRAERAAHQEAVRMRRALTVRNAKIRLRGKNAARDTKPVVELGTELCTLSGCAESMKWPISVHESYSPVTFREAAENSPRTSSEKTLSGTSDTDSDSDSRDTLDEMEECASIVTTCVAKQDVPGGNIGDNANSVRGDDLGGGDESNDIAQSGRWGLFFDHISKQASNLQAWLPGQSASRSAQPSVDTETACTSVDEYFDVPTNEPTAALCAADDILASEDPKSQPPNNIGVADTQPDQSVAAHAMCDECSKHCAPDHECSGKAWHAQLFTTFDESGNATFVDTLLKSTAAPTYFPAHQGCVDGGVVAQNPSVLAISHAIRYGNLCKNEICADDANDESSSQDSVPVQPQNVALDDIFLLSIGTGAHPMNMNSYGPRADLGMAQWVPNLMSVFNDGSLDAAHISCTLMLRQDQYARIQVTLPRQVDLANYSAWDQLCVWAQQHPLESVYAQIANAFGYNET